MVKTSSCSKSTLKLSLDYQWPIVFPSSSLIGLASSSWYIWCIESDIQVTTLISNLNAPAQSQFGYALASCSTGPSFTIWSSIAITWWVIFRKGSWLIDSLWATRSAISSYWRGTYSAYQSLCCSSVRQRVNSITLVGSWILMIKILQELPCKISRSFSSL